MSGNAINLTSEELEAMVDVIEEQEQLSIDMTLASERDMKDNLETIISFRLQTLLTENPPPSDVRNRHEAYGIAAENFCQVEASVKKIRGDMNKLLSTLGDSNLPALEAVGALLNSTTLAAMDVITMAAEMKRTMTNLYAAEQGEPTPLEQLAADGGFEEAEDIGEYIDPENDTQEDE